ncbi:hypothetical protein [Erythrobacter rubeus]|uniref:Asparagine synthetase domain-containing protein n=1 Tax=Erythrobacter rubeus TaxID=2760803 RepID=A0ABR8KVR2_9SPHN|nr:hypothetical protein [Erythrobacter rubeus]MBD2843168.1 hypothetical protein [Erythrobacter rubeus]
MIIFTAFKLDNFVGGAHVAKRFSAIENHYRIELGHEVNVVRQYNEHTRVGCHIMWQDFENENFNRVMEDEHRLVAISGAPYGYSSALNGAPLDLFELADAIKQPGVLQEMHPPFFLIDFDKKNSIVTVATDVAGYSRTYRTSDINGFCISNRLIAPHLILLKKPRLSDLGWAAEHRNGYMFDELSPFDGLHRNKPGATLAISADGHDIKHDRSVLDWFRTEAPDPFEGLKMLAAEVKSLGRYETMDVAISGGRDSRASAAFAFHHFPEQCTARTAYPPELERIIAKSLIEKLPNFDRFENEDLAVRQDGTALWRGLERKQNAYVPIEDRASAWAYAQEGVGLSSALYSRCNVKTPFHMFDTAHVSFAGNGGELGKAYYYRPNQMSGVFVKNVKTWLEEIRTIPAYARLPDHPITSKTALHFIIDEYDQPIDEIVLSRFLDAQDSGISGYRFFDYWYLVGRMAGAQTPGMTATSQILPFLIPEYIRSGGMDTFQRKVNCQLIEDMVSHYMPSWATQPYFDQIQDKVPSSQIRYFRTDEHLWSGRDAKYFLQVLEESPALDAPYDRTAILKAYKNADEGSLPLATLNVKAHSLMYRHAVYELAESVGRTIAALRDTRIRRWDRAA